MRPVGWLKVFETEAGFADTQYQRDVMGARGVRYDVLGPDEIRQLEPSLARRYVKGLFQPDSAFVASPHQLVQAYVTQFQQLGGSHCPGARAWRTADRGRRSPGLRTWLSQLRRGGDRRRCMVEGTRSPGRRPRSLDTERGYHLNIEPGDAGELRRAVMFPERGFVLAPMLDGIRLTSGVELAGLHAPPDFSRIRRLLPAAREALPGLSDRVTRQWLGYRPSTPDSLPVIGRSPHSRAVFYAFGHQHLGLTLGAVTGRLIAASVGGQQPEIDLTLYRADRF